MTEQALAVCQIFVGAAMICVSLGLLVLCAVAIWG